MDENIQAMYSQYMSDIQSMQQANNAWNAQQAAAAREYERSMSNSAHQREVQDLIKAGLNPVLSAGGSGATTTSGNAPSGSDANISAMASLMSKMLDASIASSKASAASAQALEEKSKSAENFEKQLNELTNQFGSVKGPSLGTFYDERVNSVNYPSLTSSSRVYSHYRRGNGFAGSSGHFTSAEGAESAWHQVLGDNAAADVSQTKFDIIALLLPTLANRLRQLYKHNHAFRWFMDHTPDSMIAQAFSNR